MPARDEALRVYVTASNRPDLDRLTGALSRASDLSIVGSATDSERMLADIPRGQPWLVLVDLDLRPTSGVEAARTIDQRFPGVRVIVIADQRGLGMFKETLHAGARDFLVRPVDPAELVRSIQSVAEGMEDPWTTKDRGDRAEGRLIAVVSGKGGTGKTLVSVGLAVVLAQRFRNQVTLVDLNLQAGNAHLFLNLEPRHTVGDLSAVLNQLTAEAVASVLTVTSGGLRVLPAPSRPEEADAFDMEGVSALLSFLKDRSPILVADTSSYMDDALLAILRESDVVLMVATPEIPALHNCARVLHVMDRLKYPLDRVLLVLNRVQEDGILGPQQVMQHFGRPVFHSLPEDAPSAFVMANEGKTASALGPLARALVPLAQKLLPMIDSPALRANTSQERLIGA